MTNIGKVLPKINEKYASEMLYDPFLVIFVYPFLLFQAPGYAMPSDRPDAATSLDIIA